jgi:hypothetical protein
MQNLAAITDEGGGIIWKRPRKNKTGKNKKGKELEREEKGKKKGKAIYFFLETANIPKKNSEHNQHRT